MQGVKFSKYMSAFGEKEKQLCVSVSNAADVFYMFMAVCMLPGTLSTEAKTDLLAVGSLGARLDCS